MDSKNKKRAIWLCIIGLISVSSIFAQPVGFRTQMRNQINAWGSCRTIALTRTCGVAIYGSNGYFTSGGVPAPLLDTIKRLNANGDYITDIILTEQGRWLILNGDNGYTYDGIPHNDPLVAKLREYNEMREKILSVTFNDYGEWIVITRNYFSASSAEITNWLREGHQQYGQIWTVCMTDDATVAVFENGFRSHGNVPNNLMNALRDSRIFTYVLKISGGFWFFADVDGNYQHNLQ